ncbi:MAG: radical SAM protein [Gammaproteobacteria bacterium]|nr:MAG: radical SAM protein [Gammaproteobacteria bacterium]
MATPARYAFPVGPIRPPSEGGSASLLIQVTRNCHWNRCGFCRLYRGERFELRSPAEVKADIDAIAAICTELRAVSDEMGRGGGIDREVALAFLEREPALRTGHEFPLVYQWLLSGGRTAFLQDANTLIMPAPRLVEILEYLRGTFPSLVRVTSYARAKTLCQKEPEDLARVRAAGLDRLHVGLESGDDEVLAHVDKGITGAGHIQAGRRARAAGFQLSEYWMPGLGGRELSEQHVRNTARVLNEISPDYIRTRPYLSLPGTELHAAAERGEFEPLGPLEQLFEVRRCVAALEVTARVCFDHCANDWRAPDGVLLLRQDYEGYQFPAEKPALLARIDAGLSRDPGLRPAPGAGQRARTRAGA